MGRIRILLLLAFCLQVSFGQNTKICGEKVPAPKHIHLVKCNKDHPLCQKDDKESLVLTTVFTPSEDFKSSDLYLNLTLVSTTSNDTSVKTVHVIYENVLATDKSNDLENGSLTLKKDKDYVYGAILPSSLNLQKIENTTVYVQLVNQTDVSKKSVWCATMPKTETTNEKISEEFSKIQSEYLERVKQNPKSRRDVWKRAFKKLLRKPAFRRRHPFRKSKFNRSTTPKITDETSTTPEITSNGTNAPQEVTTAGTATSETTKTEAKTTTLLLPEFTTKHNLNKRRRRRNVDKKKISYETSSSTNTETINGMSTTEAPKNVTTVAPTKKSSKGKKGKSSAEKNLASYVIVAALFMMSKMFS